MARVQGKTAYMPAARSRYMTPRFSAAIGCSTMLLMMPRKMTEAYRAPRTFWMPPWVVCTQSGFHMKIRQPCKCKSQHLSHLFIS